MTETPSNEELRKLAKKYPPSLSWYEEDFSMLFGNMKHGTYIGPREELKGESALLQVFESQVEAQFDNVDTGLGHSWTLFPKEHWKFDSDINNS